MSLIHRTHNALAALDRAPVWLNSDPLTTDELRGRVVLVDFWTYSCVNWLRTLPYVRAWDERYRERGLVVVGAHAPEFGFEHDLDNVRRAVSQLDVGYPVVVDNDFRIWRSFDNHYWPALYLAEAADWTTLQSPETYIGRTRGERRSRNRHVDDLALNQWALAGDWSVGSEAAVLEAAPASIAYRFHARDLNLVLAPPDAGAPVRFRVSLDGLPPGDAHGLDVDAAGEGTVAEPRMYQLVRQLDANAPRTFEMMFRDSGVRAYVFTFG